MSRRHVVFIAFFAGLAWLGAFAVAQGQTAPSGEIHACVSKNGAVRIVDPGVACRDAERPLSWNQQGPKGDPGLLADFDALDGLACTRAGKVGEVDLTYDSEGRAVLACVTPALCGDGITDSGETCDDGDTMDGDGCSSTCQEESAVCGDAIIQPGETCDEGDTMDGDGCSSTCQEESAVCGDARIQPGETCDEGDTMDGDGCSSTCQIE